MRSLPDPFQTEILELAHFPYRTHADWVRRAQGWPSEVVAGAMLEWASSGALAACREAAQAILRARLASEHSRLNYPSYMYPAKLRSNPT
jgi:hypothetical protein